MHPFLTLLLLILCANAHAASERCERAEQRFALLDKPHAQDLDTLSTCRAEAGQTEQAFALLARAVDAGLHTQPLLRRFSNFKHLNDDPRWPALLARVQQNEAAYRQVANRELKDLYEADQNDRRTQAIDWDKVGKNDAARRARVDALVAEGKLRHADDFYHAAMVYQHGGSPEAFARALALSRQALALDPAHPDAMWLACAAEDRYLQSIGKPQIWGTQYTQADGKAKWTMEPFDRGAKTDAERIRYGVRTLAQSAAKTDELNAQL